MNLSRNNSQVRDLVKRSVPAVCGAFERELTVKSENVARAKQRLIDSGHMIVGTSEPGGRSRKIWFIKRGFAGL